MKIQNLNETSFAGFLSIGRSFPENSFYNLLAGVWASRPYLLSKQLFEVNKSKSLKLGKRSRFFFVGRFVLRLLLNWPWEEIYLS